MTKPMTVRLYPVPGVSVYPWPAAEFDATEEQAAELLAYVPAPFTTSRPNVVGNQGPEVLVPLSPPEPAKTVGDG